MYITAIIDEDDKVVEARLWWSEQEALNQAHAMDPDPNCLVVLSKVTHELTVQMVEVG